MKSHWSLNLNSSSSQEIQYYIERAEMLDLQSKGYGIQVEGWLFHSGQRVTLSPQSSFLSFTSGNERKDVLDRFNVPSALFSGFQSVFYYPQGERHLKISLDILDENNTIIGTLHVELKSPSSGMLSSLNWVRKNFTKTNVHVGWQMLKQGELSKLWRFMQVAVSAQQTDGEPSLHYLDLRLVSPQNAEYSTNQSINAVDVIVPIYNGADLLEQLLHSLKKNTLGEYRLILIDDASTDPRIDILLEKAASMFDNLLVLHNKENLGFVASVNRGISVSRHDVVILNSDTEVPWDWLRRLTAPLHMDSEIASVTPMTNAGSIASFPGFCEDNELILGCSLQDVDAAFQLIDHDFTVEAPTGVGFCMAMSKPALDKIGPFNEELFGKGYCEENDWCQLAQKAGLRNVILPSLFVWHKHGGSYSTDEKQQLFRKNFQKLHLQHPQYENEVKTFIRADPLLPVRFLVFLFLAVQKYSKPLFIIIDHEEGGGANTYSDSLMDREENSRPVVKVTFSKVHSAFRLTLHCKGYRESAWLKTEEDLKRFFYLYEKIDFFYNNLVYYRDPEQVLQILVEQIQRKGTNLTVAVHDYLAICPAYVLLKGNGVYCGVPEDLEECRKCLKSNRFSAAPGADISRWRVLWHDVLLGAEKILVFSDSSLEILSRVYPVKRKQVVVVPHELQSSCARRLKIKAGTELHVGVVGGINEAKGAKVVAALVREMERQGRGRVTVIGKLADVEIRSKRLRVMGSYVVRDLPDIIEQSGANIFLVPSIWPETFNYTVSELIALDVPVVCFDIGAPPERVAGYQKGVVVAPDIPVDVLLRKLQSIVL